MYESAHEGNWGKGSTDRVSCQDTRKEAISREFTVAIWLRLLRGRRDRTTFFFPWMYTQGLLTKCSRCERQPAMNRIDAHSNGSSMQVVPIAVAGVAFFPAETPRSGMAAC